ncbi:MAG: single-stranded DNA-binding protein [Microcystaceae cyanobacterium]
MNNCILMVTVIRKPELRYTQENQTPIAQMLVEFAGVRSEDPPYTLKVVGWGNLGTEMQETYTEGDRLIVEGRLNMVMVQQEGFKEKRAELVANRIHPLNGSVTSGDRPASAYRAPQETNESNKVIDLDQYKSSSKTTSSPAPVETNYPATPPPVLSDADLDEIPF